jgi:hypothetical protein
MWIRIPALVLVGWLWVRIQAVKNYPQDKDKLIDLMFWMFSFEG